MKLVLAPKKPKSPDYKPKETKALNETEQAKAVTLFLNRNAPFSEYRRHRPKTLADWKQEMASQNKEATWDPTNFSVKK